MKKILLPIFAILVLAMVGGGYWLYTSLDSIAQSAIEKYGSEITQARVRVQSVHLSPTNGQGSISGLVIGNPKGFKTEYAVSVGNVLLAVDPMSATKEVILIRKIAVVAPHLIYEGGDHGSNFDVIQRNVDQYLGIDRNKQKEPGKKLVIDSLSIRDATVSYSPALLQGKKLDLPLPDIELRDIGKAKGGVTSGELSREIIGALKNRVTKAISDSVKGAVKSVEDGAKSLGSSVKGLFGK